MPLIALCRDLEARGTQAEIDYPYDDGYWQTAGWIEMKQFTDSRTQVGFADVGLISASFADEFIAKLVVEMGHLSFCSRVSFKNANPFVVRTLDNVISRRSQAHHIISNEPADGTRLE